MRFDKSILHLPWYKLYLSYLQRRQRRSSQVMSSTSKTFIQLFLKREIRGIREFLSKFLNCDTWQLCFCLEGHNFEIKTEAYTKLRFSSTTCSFFHEDLLFFHKDLFFRKLILSETASIVLGSSFMKTRSTTTSHFDYECFGIIKTFLRRSFDNRLYIISFSPSLTLNFKSRPLAIVLVSFEQALQS
jgi:hypothetical protein